MCYHMSISPLGGLADSFMATLFYHKPCGDILFLQQKMPYLCGGWRFANT